MKACIACAENEKKDSVNIIKKEDSTNKDDFNHLMRFGKDSGGNLSPENVADSYYRMDSNSRAFLISDLQQTHGNQYVQRVLGAHAKLKISQPGDIYEQEADRVAEQVMRMPDTEMQRKCPGDKNCSHQLKEQNGLVQLKADQSGGREISASNNFISNIGPGKPLDRETRVFMGSRFGYDFSHVRVHKDTNADGAAKLVNAQAYTVGRDMVFGDGQYDPHSNEGRKLIAHELTHVVQQSKGSHRLQRLIRPSLVTCPGINVHAIDRRAFSLLNNAIVRINLALLVRLFSSSDVLDVGRAMRTAFRLDPAIEDNWTLPAPHFGLPLIRRRLEAARDYINSVVFTVRCCAVGGPCAMTCGTCGGEEAFVCAGETSTIALCPALSANLNQRGRTFTHEVLHILFGFINDWGQPDRANSHCYAQFVALLNGFNSLAGFRCH